MIPRCVHINSMLEFLKCTFMCAMSFNSFSNLRCASLYSHVGNEKTMALTEIVISTQLQNKCDRDGAVRFQVLASFRHNTTTSQTGSRE